MSKHCDNCDIDLNILCLSCHENKMLYVITECDKILSKYKNKIERMYNIINTDNRCSNCMFENGIKSNLEDLDNTSQRLSESSNSSKSSKFDIY